MLFAGNGFLQQPTNGNGKSNDHKYSPARESSSNRDRIRLAVTRLLGPDQPVVSFWIGSDCDRSRWLVPTVRALRDQHLPSWKKGRLRLNGSACSLGLSQNVSFGEFLDHMRRSGRFSDVSIGISTAISRSYHELSRSLRRQLHSLRITNPELSCDPVDRKVLLQRLPLCLSVYVFRRTYEVL